MIAWHTREELVHQILVLSRQGTPARAIARALGVGRNTVRRVLAEHAEDRAAVQLAVPTRPARAPRPAKLDGWQRQIVELLGQFPDITAQRVFERLRDAGYDGSYTAVKRRVRVLRPPAKPAPSLPTPVYGPGEMAESDWSPYTVTLTSGKTITVQALSYVLVASRRKFFGLYESNDLHALMDGHVRAFTRFAGCARECKYDSQKPVVLRWECNQPIYNPQFLAFSSYYEFRPVAVRRAHPNDKPRTERSFWELERSFFNGRAFRDLDDLRAQLVDWLDRVVDHRVLERRTALERFADERDQLVPLPRHPYDTARVVYRVCSVDGFVAWAGNHYAVPYDHITDLLPVRITQRELFVYAADLRCVARHELAPRGAGLRLDPARFHVHRKGQSAIDLDQLQRAFANIGERAAAFFRLMSQAPPRVWTAQARNLLLLRERYRTEELDHALGHAAAFGARDYATVERILAARALPRTLDEYVTEQTTRRLDETLGHARAAPRDLTRYDRLPTTSSTSAHPEAPTWPAHPIAPTDPSPAPSPATTALSPDSEDTSTSSG
jgi:transposase